MIVEKVINNNLVRSRNNKQQEILVMGCGLGFKKQVGDLIDEFKIEKVYTMLDDKQNNQFEEILSRVPLSCIQITNKIVDYAKASLGKELSDTIYLTLCDHIAFAIERFKNGINIQNALLSEIKRYYLHEFQMSVHCKMIQYLNMHYQLNQICLSAIQCKHSVYHLCILK